MHTEGRPCNVWAERENTLLGPIFFNRVGPVVEISLLLNQMYVFVFGLGSYLPAAAASFITNEVQRGEAAVSASYTSVFKEFCRFGH